MVFFSHLFLYFLRLWFEHMIGVARSSMTPRKAEFRRSSSGQTASFPFSCLLFPNPVACFSIFLLYLSTENLSFFSSKTKRQKRFRLSDPVCSFVLLLRWDLQPPKPLDLCGWKQSLLASSLYLTSKKTRCRA